MSDDTPSVARCPCNFKVEIPVAAIYRGGVAYVCKCGRRYEPATVDFHALIKRDEELEARIVGLERRMAAREIRQPPKPIDIAVDDSMLQAKGE